MTKLPLAILDAFGVKRTSDRPKTTRAFAGRAAMLELWSRINADQQDQLLLAAEAILARGEEAVRVPAAPAGRR